jgi:hypothetical protein
MEVVLGGLNGIYLKELLTRALPACPYVQAAVAYAEGSHEFFERCKESEVRLQFYGLLDESVPVSLRVLELFLKDQSGRMSCRLVNGHFHAKVIWWHGVGAYIGSANLSHAAWYTNVECGLFLSDDELAAHGVGEQIEALFSYLHQVSLPLSQETYEKLSRLSNERDSTTAAVEQDIGKRFHALFGNQLPHAGLTVIPAKGQKTSRAQEQFVKEWYETLQLMRSLTNKFNQAGRRPAWVAPEALVAVHFDQFLHAYYYDFIRAGDDEGKSVEKVERAHERHKNNLDAAFEEALSWWAGLPTAPFGEDEFIAVTAAAMRAALAQDLVHAMDVEGFVQAMKHVNAFRTHARQVQNRTLGLPPGHQEDMETRARHLAEWLWQQRTEANRTVREVLEFVLYGSEPRDMETRLWEATHEPEWRLPHFGKSILGEAVGWARPNEYPPRNNRTNKALRALGYDVKLFASE